MLGPKEVVWAGVGRCWQVCDGPEWEDETLERMAVETVGEGLGL